MMARRASAVFLLVALSLSWAAFADRLGDLQRQFDQESNGVHKARLFEKLGAEQIAETRRASQAGDFKALALVMEKYRDNAVAALDALKKLHRNAEHQSGGYKQLQIQIDRGVRQVDEMLLVVPLEYRPPLQIVRRDLSSMDDELLTLLFPPKTDKTPIPAATPPSKPENDVAGKPEQKMTASALPADQVKDAPPDQPEEAPTADEALLDQQARDTIRKIQETPDMDFNKCLAVGMVACGLAVYCDQLRAAQQKDYLSSLESDKIRDAETTNERIKLFLTFADDRLKKFQYELAHPSNNKHGEMLNGLLNGYVGCVDDAADLIQLGIEKQENIRQGVDLMSDKAKEFLEALKKISAEGVEIDIYKDNLDDAMEGTRDAINDAEKAKKTVAPPPIRRKN
jgi:hypothetical protein